MPLDRFYVEPDHPTASDANLLCAFQWLLWRGEDDLHIAAPQVHILDNAFAKLSGMSSDPAAKAIFKSLAKNRSVKLDGGNRSITAAPLKPRCQARPNGACLLIWGDSKQAAIVEATLGPVGALCVLPWAAHDISSWLAMWNPAKVNCDGPGDASISAELQDDDEHPPA